MLRIGKVMIFQDSDLLLQLQIVAASKTINDKRGENKFFDLCENDVSGKGFLYFELVPINKTLLSYIHKVRKKV